MLTPDHVLALFIVSVLASAGALSALLRMHSACRSPFSVACVGLLFFVALIGGVVELGLIAGDNCNNFTSSSLYYSLGPFGFPGRDLASPYYDPKKSRELLKACSALGIMNVVFFWFTSILAFFCIGMSGCKRKRVRRRGGIGDGVLVVGGFLTLKGQTRSKERRIRN